MVYITRAPVRARTRHKFLGVLHRRRRGGVDLQIVGYVAVNTIILPARQAERAIAARALPGFEHVERREETDQTQIELGKEPAVFSQLFRSDHELVDDQVVALRRHGRDGVTHAPHDALNKRTCPDDDGRFALGLDRLEDQAFPDGRSFSRAPCR